MEEIQNVLVPLLRSVVDELKEKTGQDTAKEAARVAVEHYLKCPGEVQ